ncbi:MAG: nicotinate-nucleotide--dimethylbenzimidazole phosphoribosyltransferase [Deltaproteobacteria bacterium]|nr:nicotinate-nucleotide--dimethylbenzimidazole phosphoribosyltransferase [Deltaproteobacteria bacterium]
MELPRPRPWNYEAESAARAHLDQLTKPPGSLGKIEGLGAWLSGISGACPPRVPSRARLYTFAGDHGVTAEGVSPYPSAVTVQMVHNFLAGGAAVNVFARHHGVELVVVDVGVAGDLSACRDTDHAKFVGARVRPGTGNMAVEPAMSRAEAEAAIATGIRMARAAAADGIEVIGAGEMGIGNTTAAAACLAAVHGMPGKLTAGRGTGIDDAGLARKARVIDAAIARGRPDRHDGIAILSEVGGLEIAAIAGLCLGGAAAGLPVVLDGFISTCGGLVASALDEGVRPYLLVSHKSAENAHWAMARSMGKEPLHDLDLRLGEGTGAVLAIDSLRLAAKVMNQMATFASAGVSNRS